MQLSKLISGCSYSTSKPNFNVWITQAFTVCTWVPLWCPVSVPWYCRGTTSSVLDTLYYQPSVPVDGSNSLVSCSQLGGRIQIPSFMLNAWILYLTAWLENDKHLVHEVHFLDWSLLTILIFLSTFLVLSRDLMFVIDIIFYYNGKKGLWLCSSSILTLEVGK